MSKSRNTSPSFTELSQSEIEFVLASAFLCDVIGGKSRTTLLT